MKKNIVVVFFLILITPLFANNDMVFVEGGCMIMGKTDYKRNPPHRVIISSFYMNKNLVKMGDFKKFLSETKLPFFWDGRITSDALTINEVAPTDDCPAQGMTWLYAILYCNWLSEKENLIPCYDIPSILPKSKLCENIKWNHQANGYRLPTEAEWEYAARGGIFCRGYKYPGSNELNEVNKETSVSYEVGKMKPNELGIYDMGGLVSEWCYDWYDVRMWEWLPEENPCFETLDMEKEEINSKTNRSPAQLAKVYRGADRNEYPTASWFNRFSSILSNSSTIGIRLVRNCVFDNQLSEKKVDYSKLDIQDSEHIEIKITSDKTYFVNGKRLNDDGSVIIDGKKLKIGETPFVTIDFDFKGDGKIND